MTPQKCEICNGEFQLGITRYDESILGYQFWLCKNCLVSIISKALKEKDEN